MSRFSQDVELHPAWGIGVSIAFWFILLACSTLFGACVWAPHLVEQDRLLSLQDRQQEQIGILQSEIHQLQVLQDTLSVDRDFASRLAAADLNHPTTGTAIAVDESLRFDPHRPHESHTSVPLHEPLWCLPQLQDLAHPGPFRRNWLLVTAALCLLAFTCLHEGVFHGQFGRAIRQLAHRILDRYHVS